MAAEAQTDPTEEPFNPPPGVRRAVKRMSKASRELNQELAKWRDDLAKFGISLDIEDPNATTAQTGEGAEHGSHE